MSLKKIVQTIRKKAANTRVGVAVTSYLKRVQQRRRAKRNETKFAENEATKLLGMTTLDGKTVSTIKEAVRARRFKVKLKGDSVYTLVLRGLQLPENSTHLRNPNFHNSVLAILRSFGKITDNYGRPYYWTRQFLERALSEGKRFTPETVQAIEEVANSHRGPVSNLDFERIFERAEVLSAGKIEFPAGLLENKRPPVGK